MGPLLPEDMQALVARVSGSPAGEPLPEHLERVVVRAAGNPLFGIELCLAMKSGGGPFDEENLPDTIQGVIGSRVDQLSANLQLVLKVRERERDHRDHRRQRE